MKHVTLSGWTEFDLRLRQELANMGHHWQIAVRNFERLGFERGEEVDRLTRTLRSGTDRTKSSQFWNAEGHDWEHDRYPQGKRPDEIIYAFTLDLDYTPYKVLHSSGVTDVTHELGDEHAIVVYDLSKLTRQSENEYWFKGPAKDAALLVFTLEQLESYGDEAADPEGGDE